MNQSSNPSLSGWRSLFWVQDENPTQQWPNEDLSLFGEGTKIKLLCCLNCKSELWGHPDRCPFCLLPLPQRR